jgi:glutaminyl-peptide cyclotransferase
MAKPRSPLPPFVRRLATALAALACCGGLAVVYWTLFGDGHDRAAAAAPTSNLKLADIPFDGARTYDDLKQLCAIGARPSGSAGMETQRKLLVEHFRKCGGQVELQEFRVRHPREDAWVPMANLVVHWHPKSKERVLLCAHYDTLPFPLRDPKNPRGIFVGANDNAGGVAILMELAREMPSLEPKLGVDFVLFDGEEFIFNERTDRFFLGSEWFAREYAKGDLPYRYRWGVLLDMVGATNLQLFQERNGLWWRDTRPLVGQIWATAARLGVREFIARPKHEVSDDHVVLHDVGGISCIDVIDFDYVSGPWHTEADTPDKCSALSLAKVGWVVREWLKTAK